MKRLYPDIKKELFFDKDYKPLPNMDKLTYKELKSVLLNLKQALDNAYCYHADLLASCLYNDIETVQNELNKRKNAIVFINCSSCDFISDIIARKKLYETRTKDTLHKLIGCTIYLCETGKKQKVVRCKAIIEDVIIVKDLDTWNHYRKHLSIAIGNDFDWKDDTKVKYLYKLKNVVSVPNFEPKEGKRNGYTWMEYSGKLVRN